jgi:hypothetical protein
MVSLYGLANLKDPETNDTLYDLEHTIATVPSCNVAPALYVSAGFQVHNCSIITYSTVGVALGH